MQRINTFNRLLKLSFHTKISLVTKIGIMMDVCWERLRHGTEIQDYFQYEFYKLKSRERRRYMTFAKLRYTIRMCNDPRKREIFDDKALFNQRFGDFLLRDWLDVTTASFAQFQEFIVKHQVFFAKARVGMFGKNAGRYDAGIYRDCGEIRKLFEQLRTKGCIIEQIIDQHSSLKKYNENSVNTLRVVTLISNDGKPKIMAGVLRVGRANKTADNFHHDGIAATIDIDTGIVNSPGIDREFKRYILHPDSGEQIIGFRIPFWERVKKVVIRAAMVVPEVGYIGWDVAVDADGNAQLIEGNYGADPDVTQMPCRDGKWLLFKRELDEIKKNKF